ncbi:hypothetical protein Tco_1213134 [Tanacetum coccineum]
MVFQTERCPGAGFQQQSYSTHQESSYVSGNPQHHQSGWSTGSGYHGNGAIHHHGLTNTGGYDSSYNGNSHSHGNSFNHGHSSYGNGASYGYQNSSWTLQNLDE